MASRVTALRDRSVVSASTLSMLATCSLLTLKKNMLFVKITVDIFMRMPDKGYIENERKLYYGTHD